MPVESLYERTLAAGGRPPAARPPRASAAVVPWRRAAERVEVFWLKRSSELRFMGGWYAFPGGGLDRADRRLGLAGEPAGAAGAPPASAMPPAVLAGVDELGPVLPEGLTACAVRELFEETGVWPGAERWPAGRRRWLSAARRRLLAGELGFAELVAEAPAAPDPSRLVYAGRWLTPPLGPLRFDNRFFLLEWDRALPLQPEVIPGEAELGEWIDPAVALDRWRAGELLTAPPILHLLDVLASAGPESGLSRLREPVEANLGPHRRVEFSPGVVLFPLPTPTLPPATHTNTYLLGTRQAVLVDPGCPDEGELERLVEALEAAHARLGRRVVAIWLTHHHRDHVGGVEWLRRRLGCPVLCHRDTARRLEPLGIAADGELIDGQRVELGDDPPFTLRVVHTPGHAPGHLCFFEEHRRTLVAGDMVAGLGTLVIDPPDGDMELYLASLDRLAKLEPRVIFPAHGPVLAQAVAHLRGYRRHRLWREGRVLDAWRSGLRRPAEMLAAVYPDLAEGAGPLAERQIEAHLIRLAALGRLEPAPAGGGS